MATPLGLGPTTLRQGLLRGLIGPGAPHADFPDQLLREALQSAAGALETELSTRLAVTTFSGHLGPGPAPSPGPNAEVEAAYPWPSPLPGDGILRVKTRVRPLVEVLDASLVLPGFHAGARPGLDLPLDWVQVDGPSGELRVVPVMGTSVIGLGGLVLTGLGFPGLGGATRAGSLLLTYRAGLGPAGLSRYPQVRRLVLLRAALQVLPDLATTINPGFLTSLSADGLSQSRSSGYVFKDLEERLSTEADDLKTSLLALWDGPAFEVI